ncbi:hypothetical protein [Halostella salina]|uniref:hypothetical protein n=1 Tax=Halostella salina TaxID=1547897 RepID=UPI000EF818C9|nr:hypothetical protein [Halostella salina]
MPSTATDPSEPRESGTGSSPDRTLDWVVSVLLVLQGLLLAVVGVSLYQFASPARSREIVAEIEVQPTVVDEAVLVDVVTQLTTWAGVGTAAAGVLLLVLGAAFPHYRTRLRRRTGEPSPPVDDLTAFAVGAAASGVTGSVPLGPAAVGGVLGYYRDGDRADGLRLGLLAGLGVAAPAVVLVAFPIAATATGSAAPVAAVLAVAAFVSALYAVAVSALGGVFGAVIADRD